MLNKDLGGGVPRVKEKSGHVSGTSKRRRIKKLPSNATDLRSINLMIRQTIGTMTIEEEVSPKSLHGAPEVK